MIVYFINFFITLDYFYLQLKNKTAAYLLIFLIIIVFIFSINLILNLSLLNFILNICFLVALVLLLIHLYISIKNLYKDYIYNNNILFLLKLLNSLIFIKLFYFFIYFI